METKNDISYGVIPVFKDNNNWLVLIINQISYRGDSFWIFPKGHPNEGESPLIAAKRELNEETGIEEVNIEESVVYSMEYSFVHEGVKINKRVEYFIGYCFTKETKVTQPHEVAELRWVTLPEARELLSHQNTKDILDKVEIFLTQK
jgi:8-oxo-dGTP pyrophosphatase MutT (NUDIX family)